MPMSIHVRHRAPNATKVGFEPTWHNFAQQGMSASKVERDAMFGSRKKQTFENALRDSLPNGFELPDDVWNLIRWLENKGQCYRSRGSDAVFVPTMPVDSIDHMWSNLAFVIAPDLVGHWFGMDGLEAFVVPLVKCGADGSHLAAWNKGGNTEFVFLGSEGEAFRVTSNAQQFIVLITMGYLSLENRRAFALTPAENYNEYRDGKWPEPIEIKMHIKSTFGITYPSRGENLLESDVHDPFMEWVESVLAGR